MGIDHISKYYQRLY